MTRTLSLLALLCALAACGEERAADSRGDPLAVDPLLARALNDPLMIDPDLALRNEAAAALTVPVSHALPPLVRTEEAALAAREAARLELLEKGRVPDLPTPADYPGASGLAEALTAPAMLAAAGAPGRCAEGLVEDFAFAADMPGPARIMPHGMVQQAAGSSECGTRVVRYLTPAAAEDVLQYHAARAGRAGLRPTLHDDPEPSIAAIRPSGSLVVATRPGPGGVTAVDLVWWKP